MAGHHLLWGWQGVIHLFVTKHVLFSYRVSYVYYQGFEAQYRVNGGVHHFGLVGCVRDDCHLGENTSRTPVKC